VARDGGRDEKKWKIKVDFKTIGVYTKNIYDIER